MEPLGVRRRSPQTLDQWAGVRFGLLVVSLSRALLPFQFQQTHFSNGVRGNTCRSARVVCGNAHPVLVGSIKATEHLCEREQHTVFDLVEDTFMARQS